MWQQQISRIGTTTLSIFLCWKYAEMHPKIPKIFQFFLFFFKFFRLMTFYMRPKTWWKMSLFHNLSQWKGESSLDQPLFDVLISIFMLWVWFLNQLENAECTYMYFKSENLSLKTYSGRSPWILLIFQLEFCQFMNMIDGEWTFKVCAQQIVALCCSPEQKYDTFKKSEASSPFLYLTITRNN